MDFKKLVTPKNLLGIAIMGLGLAETLLSNKKQDQDMKDLKDEVKKEVLESLTKKD